MRRTLRAVVEHGIQLEPVVIHALDRLVGVNRADQLSVDENPHGALVFLGVIVGALILQAEIDGLILGADCPVQKGVRQMVIGLVLRVLQNGKRFVVFARADDSVRFRKSTDRK